MRTQFVIARSMAESMKGIYESMKVRMISLREERRFGNGIAALRPQ